MYSIFYKKAWKYYSVVTLVLQRPFNKCLELWTQGQIERNPEDRGYTMPFEINDAQKSFQLQQVYCNGADGINKCGWCLAGGRECWLGGLHQIPGVSWLSHHSLHFRICSIISLVLGVPCPLYCYSKWWSDGIGGGGGGVVDLYWGVGGGTGGWVSSYSFWFSLVLLYFVASGSQSLYLGG